VFLTAIFLVGTGARATSRAEAATVAGVSTGAPRRFVSVGAGQAGAVTRAGQAGAVARAGQAGAVTRAGQARAAAALTSGAAASRKLSPHAGIPPPNNPPKNLPPIPNFYESCTGGQLDNSARCNSQALKAIDQARGTEPVGPLEFNLAKFLKLSVPEQLFAIADLERVSRGEPPVAALTTQLDNVAQAGANASTDPYLSASTLSGGAQVHAWGSNWAGGTESALGSDDGWMYDDGPGGFNGDCTPTNMSGCWGHRDNILGLYSQDLASGGCSSGQSQLVMGAAYALTSSAYLTSFAEIFVAACGAKPTDEVYTWAQAEAAISVSPATAVGIASGTNGKGYFVVNSAGKLSVAGDAHSAGDLSDSPLVAPIVAIAVDEAGTGYWLVGANGEVYPFGKAPVHGDLRRDHLTEPVVGIAVDRATGGYWLVTSNGAVFSFDAPYHGGVSTKKLPKPIVAIIADPVAAGYWLVGSDGSVYPFGRVKSWGSEAGKPLPAAIVAAAVTKDGLGYWLAGANGSVFNFGDALFKGSEAGKRLPAPVTAMAALPASTGYWLLGSTGVVYRFDAP